MKKNIFKIITLVLTFSLSMFVFSNVVRADENVDDIPVQEVEDTNGEAIDDNVDEPVVDESITEDNSPEEPTNETVDGEVSIKDMIMNFLNEWLIVILASLGGAGGTSLALVLFRKFIQVIIDAVKKSAETNKESNENVVKVQETMVDGLEKLDKRIETFEETYNDHFKNTQGKICNCIDEIDTLKKDNQTFKECIALLVASNPDLASNGYATKMLELLDEGSEKND